MRLTQAILVFCLCRVAGAIVSSVPCSLCWIDDTHPISVVILIAEKRASFICFPMFHSPVEAQRRPWGLFSSLFVLPDLAMVKSLIPSQLLLGECASRWCSKTPNLAFLPHIPG